MKQCHARECLKAIREIGVTRYWTGDAYVWDVPTLDESGCHDSIYFGSEVTAQAYIHALEAVVTAQAAAITPSQKVIEELDRLGCEAFWKRYHADDNAKPKTPA